jgi:hypothetical protein
MDRITHQSPRQRGYGSTSSLRNDSLKHTRKHEKGREESNQEAKLIGSGGPSGQEGRTVRTGLADRPVCCRGPSAPTLRTVRPYVADRPLNHTEPTEATRENRPSAGSTRTVHQAPADRPPAAADRPKQHPTKLTNATDRNEGRARTRRTPDELATRGPSATSLWTVRAARTEQKTARPRRSTPPNHHWISQMAEAMETRVWGLEKCHRRML